MAEKANNMPRKHHRLLAWTAALSMAAVVVLVIVTVTIMLRRTKLPPSAVPPGVLPIPSTAPHPRKHQPASQDASCPDVQLIVVPGTWESSSQDNPLNPVQFPNALLRNVTTKIGQQFPASRVQGYTIPYTAQFHNPLSGDKQMTYNDSRAEGTRALVQEMTNVNKNCPLTSYILVGFSQGAVIAGDIASDIGNGRGPVDDSLVLGVTLIADGRRQPGVGNDIGPNPPGEGAEVTLHEVPILSNLGMTMTGARPGGFGALDGKTNEICALGDLVCAAPAEAFSAANLPATLKTLAGAAGQRIHAMYATSQFWNLDGLPATVWALDWVHRLIEDAPHPKHG
ncbi:cutinase [Mycobacterium uberis]|uniref:Cutinase n=1 Tax=Mycobacterium uberis TaxID=2162698 RepID=A0A3E1HL75_9MYCO|nr:cutinase family protein [Mycobacterium uberis]RFD27156.1 cutinase [Mycobacterium uberis]